MHRLALAALFAAALAGCDATEDPPPEEPAVPAATLSRLEALIGCPVDGVRPDAALSGTLDAACTTDDILIAADEAQDDPFDFYAFELAAASGVAISLGSSDFQPVLGLLSDTGEVLVSDDDRGASPATVEARLEPGVYVVVVTAYGADTGGRYQLSMRPSATAAAPLRVDGGLRLGR